jgi:hypothetical protein
MDLVRNPLRFPVRPALASIAVLAVALRAQAPVAAWSLDAGPGLGAPAPALACTPPVTGSAAIIALETAFPARIARLFATLAPQLPYPSAGGCPIYIDLAVPYLVMECVTDATGDACLTVPSPNDPAFLSLTVSFQAAVAEATGPVGGLHVSNGVVVSFGDTCVGAGQHSAAWWRDPQNFSSWPAPYTPSTPFASVFENAFPAGQTLGDVLGYGGKGIFPLGREAVAALLNAADPLVQLPYEPAQILSLFAGVASSSPDTQSLEGLLRALNGI